MPRQRISAVVYLLLFVAAGWVHAANLLRNSTFDTNIAQWDVAGNCFAPVWDSFGPGFTNGAMAINCVSNSMIGKVRQCVSIDSTDVDFSAEVTDNGAAGPVAFGLTSYASANCTGVATTLLDPANAFVVPDGGCCGTAWTPFARANIPVSSLAHSVLVEITVTSPADIALDNVRLGPSIFQDGFEIGT
jgi:hypothetical protein